MIKYSHALITIILIFISYFIYNLLERAEIFKKVTEINMEKNMP